MFYNFSLLAELTTSISLDLVSMYNKLKNKNILVVGTTFF